MKSLAAHAIAVLLTLLMAVVSIMAISGMVDLTNPAVSLFVGSLVGLLAGLLAAPLVWYYGAAPMIPQPEPWDGKERRGPQ